MSVNTRVLCAWLPNWPIQRLIVDRPELSHQAVLLYRQAGESNRASASRLAGGGRGAGQRVVACSSAAQQQGARNGMTLAEAQALTDPSAHLEAHDEKVDHQRLLELAYRCDFFSPRVGLETSLPPAGLLLEITGVAMLFGGEQALAESLVEHFADWGYVIRVAVADTTGLAWGLARFAPLRWLSRSERRRDAQSLQKTGPQKTGAQKTGAQKTGADGDSGSSPIRLGGSFQPLIVPARSPALPRCDWSPNMLPEIARRLPVEALRVPGETVEMLHELGVQQLDQLVRLPRDGIATRLGEGLIERLDQLLGRRGETWPGIRPPAPFRTETRLEYPSADRDLLEHCVSKQIAQVCCQMAVAQQGAIRLRCELHADPQAETADPVRIIQLGLYEPTAGARHLMELTQMQLERVELPWEVERIVVEVPLSARRISRQHELFDGGRQRRRTALSGLLNRLSSRLGGERVLQVEACSDAQPERAFRWRRWTGTPQPRRTARARRHRHQRIALATSQLNNAEGTRPAAPVEHGATHWVGRSGARRAITAARQPQTGTLPEQPLQRPLNLLPEPVRLPVISVAGGGTPASFDWQQQTYRITRVWGPERIETGWWRGPSVQRDYYRVQTTTGQRFWLYWDHRRQTWWLHGIYV